MYQPGQAFLACTTTFTDFLKVVNRNQLQLKYKIGYFECELGWYMKLARRVSLTDAPLLSNV